MPILSPAPYRFEGKKILDKSGRPLAHLAATEAENEANGRLFQQAPEMLRILRSLPATWLPQMAAETPALAEDIEAVLNDMNGVGTMVDRPWWKTAKERKNA